MREVMCFGVHIKTALAETVMSFLGGVSDADRVFVLDGGDDNGVVEHALFVFRLEDFDELVGDAAEARKNHCAWRRRADEVLHVGETDEGEVSSVIAPQFEGPKASHHC